MNTRQAPPGFLDKLKPGDTVAVYEMGKCVDAVATIHLVTNRTFVVFWTPPPGCYRGPGSFARDSGCINWPDPPYRIGPLPERKDDAHAD